MRGRDHSTESKLDVIKHGGKTLAGTKAEGLPGVFLYKLPLDATEVEIRGWRASIHGEDATCPRVSPSGKEAWWICTRGSKAAFRFLARELRRLHAHPK